MASQIQLRRDTAANWASTNPILAQGEIGIATDNGKLKIGNGTTAWSSLSYFTGDISGVLLNDLSDVTITSAANGDFLRWNGSVWINDAVNLSTDTIGSYVESLVAGTGITISNNSGEASTPTITNSGVTSVNSLTGAITGVIRESDTGTVTSTMIADGTIVNSDINASAAIAHSKLANATAGQVLLGATTTGVITATTISGDVTINGNGVTAISSDAIVNADINSSAAISLSKLAYGTAGQIIVANALGVPTWVSESGDITIDSSGVTSISSGVIVDADISASAAISVSKISGLATSATVNTTDASNITTGTLPNARLVSIPNSSLANSSITINGTSVSLGSSATVAAAAATLTGSTLSSSITSSSLTSFGVNPTISAPLLTLSTSASTSDARISWDSTNKKIQVGNGTISLDFASANVITNAQTASYTLVLSDKDKLVEMDNASANNLTVPPNSSVPFPIGTQINVLQTGAGTTTLVAGSGVTVNATPGLILRARWSSVTLIKRATDTWVAIGDLRA